MSIKHAILGFLSWMPLSGYDLKKMFENSVSFYWSGNNNQIYTTLDKLKKESLVTMKVEIQESLPYKKVYTITEAGKDELKSWTLSDPVLPKLKHSFLIQLAWSDMLTKEELCELCERYEAEIKKQLAVLQSEEQSKNTTMGRTKREKFIWNMILENGIRFYQNELKWIKELKEGM